MAKPMENGQIADRDERPQSSNRDKTAQAQGSDRSDSQVARNEVRVAEEPSGYRGENPSSAGPGDTGIRSATPENAAGHINPSSPGDTGTTPETTPEQ